MTLVMMHNGPPEQLDELDRDACIRFLGTRGVGRVAVVVEGFPVVLPVNYRVLPTDGELCIVMRTRPGNRLDAAARAGFEVDGIDPVHRTGWSVLVRGLVTHLGADEVRAFGAAADPGPWLDGRDAWLALRAIDVSGRVLRPRDVEWQLTLRAYL
ncbi:MAG TPA: pyridoxamine 5'-phosphate oxidase family protein [Acidimicrobiales bacterium]|nr:pyridoxamine 5'-phosphate oxidase family protein [Acidimicrobiales bacterium]